ncbi:glucosidase [Methylococcus sp. EFPC2]|uniref:MGH1-like glycoside hydrolase domain-containing protein n=1 Tax=Methylococcus sp. EFPC2 TaxID=2812648 RepID=UPI001967D7CB|nr:glucosidase [Methylococcus sp. EFPC2]QSA97807.1 glucosidase [Methylococcus sp. EFPC2]
MNAEEARLEEARQHKAPWKKWGPYLSERQWGTVREDYSEGGDAWNYFSHDQARSRAYRWGEDGLAGISDDQQRLCFALALWNGKDPIIKERLFGLTNSESNHGEDVKEYYFYLDSTPTHSYLKYLYKYPQAAYPYGDIVETSRRRGRNESEYELLDTGVFDQDRYWDVFVEYAKASPEDLLIQISVHNRGPEAAKLYVLPTLWFRNQWSWHGSPDRPALEQLAGVSAGNIIKAVDSGLGERYLYCEGDAPFLFTENETNTQRIFGIPNRSPYVKDSINEYIVHDQEGGLNPEKKGTKVAAHYCLTVNPEECQIIRLRLSDVSPAAFATTRGEGAGPFGGHFEKVFRARRNEADEFYAAITPPALGADAANVMRQALAGMLWSKQFYHYDVDKWLEERGSDPFKPRRKVAPRNDHWHHMYNGDVISMPDKWEYPWYAAWDLAFHVIALTLVDPDLGKQQLKLMLRERYMHPNGQIPAYEWNFGDVNPPVHAWSTIFTYHLEKAERGEGDKDWLKSCFQKLLLNFTWWVNRKDRSGRNVFEGGFLGLDNIGVFDRNAPLPTGGYLEQADGTAWMALFSQNMLEIAAELAPTDVDYADMALKFLEHFLWIGGAMAHLGEDTGMWDEEDGFFYDVLRLPDGQAQRLKVRSMVGLLPLCAATVFEGEVMAKYPEIGERFQWFLDARPELCAAVHDPRMPGVAGRRLASILDETKLRRVLKKMLDENEFLGPYGLRSLSRYHANHPYVIQAGGQEYRVAYLPAESDTGMFGGNSNWRGPIWMPVNALIIRALLQYHLYYGNDFTVECPTGSGRHMNLYQVAEEISRRLASIFLQDQDGRRPVYGGSRKFQEDPHWRDCLLFYEYFHGDNGTGLGASHQTGWTGVVARTLHLFASLTPEQALEGGNKAYAETAAEERSDRGATAVKNTGS